MPMPKTLAQAEPTSPHQCTNIGTAIAPGIKPASVKYNGRLVSCTPRNQPFPAISTSVMGIDKAATCSHEAARLAVSGLAVIHKATCRPNGHRTQAISTPPISATYVACTPSAIAPCLSPDPHSGEDRAVVP